MKQLNITIHPFSALAGMALLAIVLVTASAMPLQGSSSTRDVSAIENVNEPHPRDAVRVVEGSPYTVSTGRLLVVTGMGTLHAQSSNIYVEFDGSTVLTTEAHEYDGSVASVPFGLVAAGGQVVSVTDGSHSGNYGVLLGYLVDA
jgi:hypothetical protein